MEKEYIEDIFKKTLQGLYMSECVKHGTMDKDFYKNQLDTFISGFEAAKEQKPDVDEQKKLWAEKLLSLVPPDDRPDGIWCPICQSWYGGDDGVIHDSNCPIVEAKNYLEVLDGGIDEG